MAPDEKSSPVVSASGFRAAFSRADWIRTAVGVALIVAGIVIARRAFDTWGADFAPQYMAAWMLREGKNVYDFAVQRDGFMRHIGEVTTWAFFYPPSAAVAALPATVVSYPVAREIWFVAAIAIMFFGLWRFMGAFFPSWHPSLKCLVLGLVMCTAGIRWGFKVAQPGSIVLGLFALFLVALKENRALVAFLCGAVIVSIKVTFGIPFFLVALAQRRFVLTGAMLAFWLTLNVIGLYGMGGPGIIADYKANFAEFERPDELNYPDPRGFNSLARTDWPYIFNAVDPNFSRNNLLGHALSLLTLAWLAWEALRAGPRLREDVPLLAFAAPVAAISMLAVYHHHYDMSLLLLPLIAYLGHEELRRSRAAFWYMVPVGVYVGLFPYQKAAQLIAAIIGEGNAFVVKVFACAVCIAALGASLLVLHRILWGSAERVAGPIVREH